MKRFTNTIIVISAIMSAMMLTACNSATDNQIDNQTVNKNASTSIITATKSDTDIYDYSNDWLAMSWDNDITADTSLKISTSDNVYINDKGDTFNLIAGVFAYRVHMISTVINYNSIQDGTYNENEVINNIIAAYSLPTEYNKITDNGILCYQFGMVQNLNGYVVIVIRSEGVQIQVHKQDDNIPLLNYVTAQPE